MKKGECCGEGGKAVEKVVAAFASPDALTQNFCHAKTALATSG